MKSMNEYEMNEIITDVTCNGRDNGSIEVNASGGSGDYTYEWYNNNIIIQQGLSNIISNLSPGNYNIKITDNNNSQQIRK